MSTRRRTALLASAAGSVAAAAVGGLGARRAPEVYGRIAKPRWAPPAAAFGPVWTVLYAGIAAAGARIG
ncbi:MAG: tryptophan-rich sensory protein, partial [Actinomycetes bacterium]